MPRIEMGENPKTGLSGLADAKARKIADIDHATSASILGGFDYMVGEKLLHFSYDSFDQQNFADAANAGLLATISQTAQTVTWNAYSGGVLVRLELDVSQFLDLYANGALAHKARCMEAGGQRKAMVEAAATVQEVNNA